MSRSALIILAALVVAGAAAGTISALPASQTADGPIAMLTLDSPSQSDQVTQSIDVSNAVDLQREAAVDRIAQVGFQERYADADTDSEERRVVRDELSRLDDRIDELQERERELRMGYVRGEIDGRTYLQGLAKLDSRATALRRQLVDLRQYTSEGHVDVNEILDMEARMTGYSGPVRERARAALLGQGPAGTFDLQASDNGTTLATIDGRSHIREAYRSDERSPDELGTIPSDELYGSFTNELVSDVYEIEPQSTGIRPLGRGLYQIDIRGPLTSPYLTVTAHVDGDTRGIFYEVQERSLNQLPSREAVEATENGTRLVVNRSFTGGPLRIATYDLATGAPTASTVVVDGKRYRTDADGELWVLTPRRFEFSVTAVGSSGNVSVDVRTIYPTSVNAGT